MSGPQQRARRRRDPLAFFPFRRLCDVGPAYGLIFVDAIEGFDFWGHCDMDLVFDDIRRFLTPDILQAYTKVLIHGHLSLHRNRDDVNHYFEIEAPMRDFGTQSPIREACNLMSSAE
jgi:hypothetical protein